MAKTQIPNKIQVALWAKAAGRCEYRACNEDLTGDLIAGREDGKFGFIAHIVADSADGPRGDVIRSPLLAKDLTNLMLLCAKHHKGVDVDYLADHPEDVLLEMKAEHEDRIAIVTGMAQERAAHVLRFAADIGHLMVSRQETARPLLTPGEVMQLPPSDEIVMVAGVPPIRATKARYFEDPRFRERVLPPPDLRNRSVAVGGLRPSDDWSDLTPAATSGPSDAPDNHAGDPANAGIRREPELPEQEEIVPPPPAPVQEFDLLDDEPDVDAAQARAIRQRMRMVARQVAMNPDDGINL